MDLFLPNDLSLPRPTFEPLTNASILSEIRSVLHSYEGGDKPGSIERFSGPNVITQNYRVQLDKSPLLLKSREGITEKKRLLAETQLAERLLSKDVPVPRVVRTTKKDLIVTKGERHWTAYAFQEGDYFQGNEKEFKAVAEGFARLTQAMNEEKGTPVLDHEETRFLTELEPLIHGDEHEGMVMEHLQDIRTHQKSIEHTVAWVHVDFHPQNVLMQSGRLTCILDMEDIKPYSLLAALGFGSYKLLRQLWTRPEVRGGKISPKLYLDQWLAGWHQRYPNQQYSKEQLGQGARYRVLALIYFILENVRQGDARFLSDLQKQIFSLLEIETLYQGAGI